MALDLFITNFLHGFAGRAWPLDWLGIIFATYVPYLMVVAVCVTVFYVRGFRERLSTFFFLLLSVLISRGIITEVIRFFYYRPRPFVALNFTPLVDHDISGSFPSGHAIAYFALAFAVYAFNKRAGIWLLVASTLMGIARIYAGVHWFTDIAGGALLAWGVVYVLQYYSKIEWFFPKEKKEGQFEEDIVPVSGKTF